MEGSWMWINTNQLNLIRNLKSTVVFPQCSGVATGWYGWTMSRGPGAKGAPES